MPIYEFQCPSKHVTESYLPVAAADLDLITCGRNDCRLPARRMISLSAVLGSESLSTRVDERLYRKHNVTRPYSSPGEGVISAEPVSPANQCQCGNCGAHRKRSSRTATADVGKGV